jgi:hypothetical protein
MGVMLAALCAGHANFGLGAGPTLKSAAGWAKGWALFALFIAAGILLPIRLDYLVRCLCRLGRQCWLLIPAFALAPLLSLPWQLWVSPLAILGGAGEDFFAVNLYSLEPGTGAPRWQFFAPWSPAAGMVAVMIALLVLFERDWRWRATGFSAAIAMALMSQSRLALVALAAILPLVWGLSRLNRPALWYLAVPVVLAAILSLPTLVDLADAVQSEFTSARADSSRVRAALGRIALERWENEAYWFGHGVVERGPHLVEYMPIGSHHSWYGLLFVKGLVGALALALPMLITLVVCIARAQRANAGKAGLAMALLFGLYSFGENLEILSYLIWPAAIVVGIALRAAAAPDIPPAATAASR